MALPTTRDELITYVRTRLGEPVIEVNVSNTQIEQRIDDALQLYQDYHYDGSEKVFLKYKVTPSVMTLNTASTGTFANGEYLVGLTSNVEGKVVNQANSTSLNFHYTTKPLVNTFIVGETVMGRTSNATADMSSNANSAIVLGDYDNEWIPVSNLVLNITRVITDEFGGAGGSGLFSFNQYLANEAFEVGWFGDGALSYVLAKSNLEMYNDLFNGSINVRFNRHVNRLYLDMDWRYDTSVGRYIVVEAQQIIDPNVYADIWHDRFILDYTTALVKKQWGQNLSKFSGITMPGGITMNGVAIYTEGTREVELLESTMASKYEIPPEFIVA